MAERTMRYVDRGPVIKNGRQARYIELYVDGRRTADAFFFGYYMRGDRIRLYPADYLSARYGVHDIAVSLLRGSAT